MDFIPTPKFLTPEPLGFNPSLVFPGIADLNQPTLWISIASICFNPLYWNLVSINEYNNRTITKLLGGRNYLSCYLFAASIFLLGVFRDHLFQNALRFQPTHPALTSLSVKAVGALLIALGQVLVLSSTWALGITGTFLGDHFGILMDDVVTAFPFNLVADPMYWGSSLSFAGVSLWLAKPSGLLLTSLVVAVYAVALRFEGPFTANIYASAAREKARQERLAEIQSADGPARGTRSKTSSPGPPKTRSRKSKKAE